MKRPSLFLIIAFLLCGSAALADESGRVLYRFDFDYISAPGEIFEVVKKGAMSDLNIESKLDGKSLLVDKRNNTGTGFYVLDPDKFSIPNKFSIEADFKVDASKWKKNAHFGFTEGTKLWKAKVGLQGDQVKLLKGGTTLKEKPISISSDQRHHLRLMVDGTDLTVYLNGKKKISHEEYTMLQPGFIGIYTAGSKRHATWYDNLIVKSLEKNNEKTQQGSQATEGEEEEKLQTWLSTVEKRKVSQPKRGQVVSKILDLGKSGAKRLYPVVMRTLQQTKDNLQNVLIDHAQNAFQDKLPSSKEERQQLMEEVKKLRKKLQQIAQNPDKTKIKKEGNPARKRLSEIYLVDRTKLLSKDNVQPLIARFKEYYDYRIQCEDVLSDDALIQNAFPKDPGLILKRIAYLATLIPISNKDLYVNFLLENEQKSNRIKPSEALAILDLNRMRLLMGLHPLRIDPRLCSVARDHSSDMNENGFFSHTSPLPGKRTPRDRAANVGTSATSENIAKGTGPLDAHEQWYHSPDAHKKMLKHQIRFIGLGFKDNFCTEMFR